jgi:hypothetical protein
VPSARHASRSAATVVSPSFAENHFGSGTGSPASANIPKSSVCTDMNDVSTLTPDLVASLSSNWLDRASALPSTADATRRLPPLGDAASGA